MRKITAAAAAILAAVTIGAAAPADARKLEPADTRVHFPRVAYLERLEHGRAYVELNNGAAYDLRPCALEDSSACYWDARARGNGRGMSFVSVHVGARGTCVLYVKRPARNECSRGAR